MEPHQPHQHDHFAACVIVQQYSSITFVSMRFHFRKKNLARFKTVTFLGFFYFLKIA
jgi:hypothetical protein